MTPLLSSLVNEVDAVPLYRALAAYLPGAAVFLVDANLRYVLADGPVLRASGLSPADFEGKTVNEVQLPDTARREAHYRQALAGQSFEHTHRQGDRDYSTSGVPLRNNAGEVYAVLAVSYDITERVRAERALRESAEQFRRAIEDAPIPVIMHAEDGEVLQVSRSWTELTGYTLEDKAVIQTWLTRAYGFGGEGVRDAMERSFAPQPGNPMRAVIFDITTRQGERRTWSFSASTPGTLRDGRQFVVGMAEDITEHKRHEANLAFLADISQDLVRLTDVGETMSVLGAKIGAHFGLSQCLFVEVDDAAGSVAVNRGWHREDVPSVAGNHQMADFVTPKFQQASRAGETVVVRDVSTDARTDVERYAAVQIGSFINVPLVRDGEWRFMLSACRSEAYDWRADEVELMREIATRIWTRFERARAEEALQALNTQLEQRVADRTEALRQSHEEVKEISMHMETTREDERTRIAREVHDELGGHLTALKIELGSLAWGRESDGALNQRLSEAKTHIDEIVQIVRRIGSDLRPPVLDDYGLIPALEWHAHEWERRTGIRCLLDLVEDKPPLSRDKRTAIFRAFQEALTNVARHAHATCVNVTMAIFEGELILVIEDNGVGIPPEALTRGHSLGLMGMQERLAEVGGVVEFEGQTGQGTVVSIRLPV